MRSAIRVHRGEDSSGITRPVTNTQDGAPCSGLAIVDHVSAKYVRPEPWHEIFARSTKPRSGSEQWKSTSQLVNESDRCVHIVLGNVQPCLIQI